MLRALLLVLVAANLVYAAWWRGWLPAELLPLARGDAGQREPGRLAAQVHPEYIELLAGPPADRLASSRCLQAGPFTDEAWPDAEAAVSRMGLASGQWLRVPADPPGSGSLLRVPEADATSQERLQAGEPELGRAFSPCP